jgi:hypothetical protein
VLDVFDHHDGAVDQQADGDREAAKRHDVGRPSQHAHHAEGGQHRQRQDQRNHQRRTQIAEEQQQQDDDEYDRLEQHLLHRPYSLSDQFAAVVEDHDARTIGQLRRELVEAGLDPVHHGAGIGAAQSEHDAPDGFAGRVGADHAVAGERSEPDIGDVADADDDPVARRHHGIADVVQGLDATLGANQQGFLTAADATGTVVAVVDLERLLQHLCGDAARGHRGG